jgi:hypothetical protein
LQSTLRDLEATKVEALKWNNIAKVMQKKGKQKDGSTKSIKQHLYYLQKKFQIMKMQGENDHKQLKVEINA